ncbi:hypothetical protein SAMN05443572_102354 [Myxococcus fulvus]|uniref:Uncharacterized protein n=1 Tax=Myxococcus fulvus TaxID=33 RepID=A0A511SXB3_MYXFU|nr:hypothetical protein [Myxococcus fulvus]GEN06535.1 hypothetical protein MFU01_15720 [Myxococcus fulvus]SET45895.1 hypothetical protein SAMN05443572_102354 [Myxococcus fulvus]
MAGPYVYFFFKPERVTLLEGFSTKVSVWGVPKNNPSVPENVTHRMYCYVENGDTSIRIYKSSNYLQVSGLHYNTSPATVTAVPLNDDPEFPRIKTQLKCTVEQSDVLIYAPDGHIYWINQELWQQAERLSLTDPRLSKDLPVLLKNETVVANLPVPQDTSLPVSSASERMEPAAEPITCFLLNLNSILLSYTPGANLQPGEQGPVYRHPDTEP